MWKILVILLCLTALILLVVMICDSNRFVKVSYRISDRRLKKNCRVVLLADLHNKSYGKHNEKLLAAIKSSNPDLILCAGDLITSRSGKSMEHERSLSGRFLQSIRFIMQTAITNTGFIGNRKPMGKWGHPIVRF